MHYRWVAFFYKQVDGQLDDWTVIAANKDGEVEAATFVINEAKSLGFIEANGWWIVMDHQPTKPTLEPYNFLTRQEERVRS